MGESGAGTFVESAAFNINHGAGHNSNMQEAGKLNGFDDQGNPKSDVYIPSSPNVMTNDKRLWQGVQKFIEAPANTRQAQNGDLSIQRAYEHRFGTNTPNATLPHYE